MDETRLISFTNTLPGGSPPSKADSVSRKIMNLKPDHPKVQILTLLPYKVTKHFDLNFLLSNINMIRYAIKLLLKLHETMHIQMFLVQCLAHNRGSKYVSFDYYLNFICGSGT